MLKLLQQHCTQRAMSAAAAAGQQLGPLASSMHRKLQVCVAIGMQQGFATGGKLRLFA
jgi:hypothetical protein